MRIPLTILKSGGKEFGESVLDDLLRNGLSIDDLNVIGEADSILLETLREYYKSRLLGDM